MEMIKENLSRRLELCGSVFFLIAFIAAHFAYGIKAAVKVMGVASIFTGATWIVRKSVPVGIESRPPSFHANGLGARLLGIVMIAFGIALLFYSLLAVCLLGWGNDKDCS